MLRFIAIFMAGILWTSCSDNPWEAGKMEDETRYVPVLFKVTTPATKTYSGSENASRQPDTESTITEIQVLVFENGNYKYHVPGLAVSSNGSSTTFKARLSSSAQPLKLYLVINATDAVVSNGLQEGDTEAEVKKKIKQTFTESGINEKFPMFGEYDLPSGLTAGQNNYITGIKVLRSIARIDVKAGEISNFKLTSIEAYRANSQIQVLHNETGLTVSVPSIPETDTQTVHTLPIPVEGNESISRLYLPESAAPSEDESITKATCLVVGGIYEDEKEATYYRIDFDSVNTDNAFGQILRNHNYIFNIKSVTGPGWENPDDAAANRSSQMEVEIKAWDDLTQDMYFDGMHHFGVSAREAVLKSKPGSTDTIFIDTDISDYTLQWADAQGSTTSSPASELSNSYFKVQKTDGISKLLITALQDNSSASGQREDHFIITANRWQILIKIRQRNGTAANRTINLMTFYSGLGYLGSNILPPLSSGETRADGLRGILTNTANFGPTGTVECGGFNLIMPNVSYNKLTDLLFATADILYVHYMGNSVFGNLDAQKAHNWLKANKNRVLIVSMDANDVSVPILTEILGETSGLIWARTNNGPFPLAGKSNNNYFTDSGPFTVQYGAIPANFSFRNFDIYHGEIGPKAESGITPILRGPEGGIVLGVDYSRRIIYCGDVDLGYTGQSQGTTNDNRITNSTGTIESNAAKLIANVFAWAVGVITSDCQS